MVSLLFAGCQSGKPAIPAVASPAVATAVALESVDVNDVLLPALGDAPVAISAAHDEWVSFALQIDNAAANPNLNLRLTLAPAIASDNLSAFQAIPMAVDTNRAGYVRQTGLSSGTRQLPRALVPLPCANGIVDLTALRSPSHPFDAQSKPGAAESPVVWIDLHIPDEAAAGDHTLRCELVAAATDQTLATLTGTVHVYDFALPQERNLHMVSPLQWDRLQQLYTDAFEAITPRLMNRGDDRYAAAIHVLDQLEELAHLNRTDVFVPRLQPTVKWSEADRPQVDWSDFDTVVSPWLDGDGMADKQPVGFWPVPHEDYLDNYDAQSQRQYWGNASTHFNRMDWLDRSAVILSKRSEGRATLLESVQLSMDARAIMESHPLTRVMLPLEDDQVQFESGDNPAAIPVSMAPRVVPLAPGLVFGAPTQTWPDNAARPEHWLNTDAQGLVPYVGAGTDERDVRLWAWLAYLRHADLIQWPGALPDQDDPIAQADPGRITWFYPGSWFGIDGPVPSVQLKWLRRAEEDYEYLLLAEQRGMRTNAFLLARLLTRQVELQPVQAPDPEYGLLSGTVDEQTWDEAHDILARSILARPVGAEASDPSVASAEQQLNLDIIRWQAPKERPYLLPRSAQWSWDDPSQSNGDPWVFLRLGVDIYNAGDNKPEENQLQWTGAGDGWEFKPQPVVIGALRTYWVQRFTMDARVNLANVTANSRKPMEITFVDGYTKNAYPAQAMLPVATSVRREGELRIDGKLDDWAKEDLIQDGPLTKMVDRPSIQHWRIEPASTDSKIYTGWSDDNFYLAFHVAGTSAVSNAQSNFVDYQFRRAWGEDLCEALVQPIYDDNSVGPLTYMAFKPSGVCVVKRRLDPRTNADPWRDIEGTSVRYADIAQAGSWNGEVAIPWRLLLGDSAKRPRLLKFNFIQHVQSTGESDSWAGPVDYDQDDSVMGLVYLQELSAPGMPLAP